MKQKTLLKFSFTTTIVMLLLLTFLSMNLRPKETKISEINEKMLNEWVYVKGTVVDEKVMGNEKKIYVFIVQDEDGKIEVFYDSNLTLNGCTVKVLGKVFQYKSKLEIEAKQIEIIKC